MALGKVSSIKPVSISSLLGLIWLDRRGSVRAGRVGGYAKAGTLNLGSAAVKGVRKMLVWPEGNA